MGVRVGVVGSGAAGMAAAFRLQQAGYYVRLFEANDYLGGRMASSQRDGFVIDHGGTLILSNYHSILGIVHDAGLDDELVKSNSTIGVLRDGKIHCLDSGRIVRDALRTGIISPRSKLVALKLASDILRVRRHFEAEDLSGAAAWDTRSAGDYARTRLNLEILENLVEPITFGLSGGRADDTSVVSLFFIMSKFLGSRFLEFRGGTGSYPAMLGRRFDVELGARVIAVEERAGEAVVTWRNSKGVENSESLAGCVVTVPPPMAVDILPGLDQWRADFLRQVRCTKSTVCTLGLSRRPAAEPAAYVLTPSVDDPGLLGFMLEHNRAPGRVPAGKGLVSVYTGASPWLGESIAVDDNVITKHAVETIDRILPGTAADVEFAEVKKWDVFGPTSPVGFWTEMRRFQEIRKSKDRLIQLAGDYFAITNINSASATGERAARELLATLTPAAVVAAGVSTGI